MKAKIEQSLLDRIIKITKICRMHLVNPVQSCKSCLILLCLLFFSSLAAGQQQTTPSAAAKYFSDVELLNQDGQKLRFYSDVLKDKVVIINAFFSTCTSVCPPMNRNLEKIQDALGDRLGKDVFLVSISVDPETDTPTRLKEYSRRFHARPGWLFLTGKKENVDWALYKLGQYVETKNDHTTVLIIGNEPKGLWKKAFGLAKSDELIRIVDDVINDR
jgi:protein SCO1/2